MSLTAFNQGLLGECCPCKDRAAGIFVTPRTSRVVTQDGTDEVFWQVKLAPVAQVVIRARSARVFSLIPNAARPRNAGYLIFAE
jgi:hypothetical protein